MNFGYFGDQHRECVIIDPRMPDMDFDPVINVPNLRHASKCLRQL